jgi:hypothetical protein
MSPSHSAGTRNGNAKVTGEIVREIIKTAAYDADVGYQPGSIKALAERFGITRDAVRMIARGLRWKTEWSSAGRGRGRLGRSNSKRQGVSHV